MPFKAKSLDELLKVIMETELEFEYDVSAEAEHLVRGLLQKDPLKRLTIPEILDHPWLTGERTSTLTED